ncbi:MAG TPA: SDR family oxidoreductase [Polyangiales bacterium]|nr:SDR family oxidoreductase [Polyangiales bacterium]
MSERVLVVIGVGGMGEAIARRLGSGRSVLLADYREATLMQLSAALTREGFKVSTRQVDVASRESMRALAQLAAAMGDVQQVVHTAGVSPVQASAEQVLRVDLYGVAVMLDEFARVIAQGGAGVVIASMAGHVQGIIPADIEQALMRTDTEALLDLPFLKAPGAANAGTAYAISKRANLLRVMAAASSWGQRGARINSISPGIISTPMQQEELSGASGERVRGLVAASALGRMGTTNEIAEAAAFLLSPMASFITGTDLLVDAGALASLRSMVPAARA